MKTPTWTTAYLRDVTTKIGTGATPRGGSEAYKTTGVPLIRSLNVYDDGFREQGLAYLDDEQAARLDHVIVQEGDVLLNITGASVARCCIAPKRHLPARVNQHVSIIRPCSDVLCHRFLHYLLIAGDCKKRLLDTGEGGGTTRQAITKSQLQDFRISFPPLPEQRRIVAVLDEAFEGIAAAKANAERNLRNGKEVFESRRNSALTDNEDDWTAAPLVSVCQLINGRAYKKPELLSSGRYRVLRVGNFFTSDQWYYSDLELDPEKYCETGDLLYAWSASFGPRIWSGEKAIFHYHIWRVMPDETKVRKAFLYQLLEWDVDNIKQAHGTGTTMIHVSKGSMEARVVPIPPLAKQERLIGLLEELADQSGQLEAATRAKLAALDELKASLLHQAFTGQL